MRQPLAIRRPEQSPRQVAKARLNRQMGKDRPTKQLEPLQQARLKVQRLLEEQLVHIKVRLRKE